MKLKTTLQEKSKVVEKTSTRKTIISRLIVSLIMATIMSFSITLVHTDITTGVLSAWLRILPIALVIAPPTALVVIPVTNKMIAKL